MSGRFSGVLQGAIYSRLAGDFALSELVDGIHDAPPPSLGAETIVLIGEDEVQDRSDSGGAGAEHRLLVTVLTEANGFLAAKAAAARICDLLEAEGWPVPGVNSARVWFEGLRARRAEAGRLRRVELRFRARLAW